MMFTWQGVRKTYGSNLVGVSPEFELALCTPPSLPPSILQLVLTRRRSYTMAYLHSGEGKHLVELGDFEVRRSCRGLYAHCTHK
jgi:hypothetical protein